ncbi:hypothetical protein LTR37_013074 [Vermiconidia calcicola]|uniref:Uncharacterized protein n=1 Tax=Vermiconidia calcicola TaxID=1690605 RepID=A0ACC3MY87_9PEZI|nr:hypothetical protein LTR37_013074 [Vermiconidia calcicola]
MTSPSLMDDERYARELQAEIENEEHPKRSAVEGYAHFDTDPRSISEDERYARELQEELHREMGFERMLTDEHDRPLITTSPRITDAAAGFSKSARGRLQDSVMDDSNDANHVRQFTSRITTTDCARCHNPQTLSKEGLADMFNAFIASEAKSISFFHICNNCRGKTCFGCRMSLTTAVAYGNVALNNKH